MDNSNDLNPQVPGQIPGVDPNALQPLLELELVDLVAGLPALTDAEVDELVALEAAGEKREAYAGALTTEQMRRLEDAEPVAKVETQPAENAPAPLGDNKSYAHLSAKSIDPSTLERAVLSKDGWVLPAPAASAE